MALSNSNLNSSNNNNNAGGGAQTAVNSANNNNNDVTSTTNNENLVVRVDDSSQDNLQALFDSVLKPNESKRPLQVPLRMRKLPSSFFNPPAAGSKSPSVSHSRENSADSAFGSGSTTLCSPTAAAAINPAVTSRFQISHSRAHSSPASLQQTYAGLNVQNNNAAVVAAVAAANAAAAAKSNAANAAAGVSGASVQTTVAAAVQAPPQQPIHIKQRSYDVVSAIQLREELGELPPGWEQARTAEGQIYYLK